jgi:F0F1-type ATP synthase gamma subunit
MPEWATEVLTWDQIREIVDIGTVESLGRLRRSEQQLKTYHAFMDKVSKALQHLERCSTSLRLLMYGNTQLSHDFDCCSPQI